MGCRRRGLFQLGIGSRQGLSPPQQHPRRLGNRSQCAGDGVRQYGRYQRDRRCLHPRSCNRRKCLLWRVSDQRAGRGCRRRHPHAAISYHGGARGASGGQAAEHGRSDAGGLCRAGARVRYARSAIIATCRISSSPSSAASLWMLQTRSGKRTAKAALKIAVDMAAEGLITREEAVLPRRSDGARPIAAPDA
jgi:hypothetical protein